jgi:hypothetical protein
MLCLQLVEQSFNTVNVVFAVGETECIHVHKVFAIFEPRLNLAM